jgi:hypothetical protein
MKPARSALILGCICLLCAVTLSAKDKDSDAKLPPLTKEGRIDLIRTFTTDLVYIRTPFPMGNKGLTLKHGALSPNGRDLQILMATFGPSVRPGDRALISSIEIRKDRLRFVINGGPVQKKKWYQHIAIGVGGDAEPIAPGDPSNNPRGTFVDLDFDHYVPNLTPKQVMQLLAPVFDFNSPNGVDAYLETVPPKVKAAIKSHHVLVGMNREMVTYAKGLPPKKIREKDSQGNEYEEWIYGEPPQDVDFIRLVGDEVIRVETMKVDGQKVVRTQKEVELPSTVAAGPGAGGSGASPSATTPSRPSVAPSLRRPGEQLPDDNTNQPGASNPNVTPTLPPINAPPAGTPPPAPAGIPDASHP